MDTPVLTYIPYDAFVADVRAIGAAIGGGDWRPDFLVGIGRGGLVPAAYLSHGTGIAMLSVDHSAQVPDFAGELLTKLAERTRGGERMLFVDDINDSGSTIAYLLETMRAHGAVMDHVRVAVLITNVRSTAPVDYWSRAIDRAVTKDWFVFPWESMQSAESLVGEAQEVPERIS